MTLIRSQAGSGEEQQGKIEEYGYSVAAHTCHNDGGAGDGGVHDVRAGRW